MANRQRTLFPIELDDVFGFQEDPELGNRVMGNTKRYMQLFASAIYENLPEPTMDLSAVEDVLDVLRVSCSCGGFVCDSVVETPDGATTRGRGGSGECGFVAATCIDAEVSNTNGAADET